jgi:hypothetical protein
MTTILTHWRKARQVNTDRNIRGFGSKNHDRFPRTLNEAFGPHTSDRISSADDFPPHEKVLFLICAFAFSLVLGLLLWERFA